MNTNNDDTMTDDDLIADSVARLFGDHVDKAVRDRAETGVLDTALWQQVANAGLPLMLATEAAGGLGQGWLAAYPVLRGLGHWQVPLPLAETMVAAQLLSQAGLPVPDGPLTLIEQGQGNTLQAAGDGAVVHVSGTAHRVPWARHAQGAVLSLRDGRLALLDLRGGPGVTLQPHANHAGLPADTLVFSHARCVAVARNPTPLAQPVWTLGAVARSAMMVGALEWALAQTVGYAGDRVQFGKPIGKNQAIQQNLALMAGDVAAARVAALVAAADASGTDGGAAVFSAAVAKVRCGEAATRGTGIAHQVHGAIGFTHEHALHFATRRLWAWREEFGSDAHWAAELGRAAIAQRADGFWPAVTAKHFPSMS
jgi:acyl-CoA dehydrogenase